MRTLWLIVSTLALAHVLAIGGVIGWLAWSDRLDRARIERVREVFAPTLAEERARAAEAAAAARAAEQAAAEAAKASGPLLTAAQRLSVREEEQEVDRQRLERLKREVSDLQAAMQREREIVEEERRLLVAERAEFEAMRARLEEIEGGEQFKKALRVLAGLKPDDAKAALMELVRRDDAGTGTEQVVSYLNALPDRTRTKVMAEFLADDPKLAADLLERLRTRGLVARAPGEPGG